MKALHIMHTCTCSMYTDARVYVLKIRVLCAFQLRCTRTRFKLR